MPPVNITDEHRRAVLIEELLRLTSTDGEMLKMVLQNESVDQLRNRYREAILLTEQTGYTPVPVTYNEPSQ